MESNGKAICVDSSAKSFQIATHADGPCEQKSNLGSKSTFLKDDLENGKRYDENNLLLTPKQLDEKYALEQKDNPELIKNFLNSFLARKNNGKGIDFSAPLTEESLKEIVNIKAAFDTDIINARESCIKASKNKNNEPKFWAHESDPLKEMYDIKNSSHIKSSRD